MLVQNANSVDPDQRPRSLASDLGLRVLAKSVLWDAKLTFTTAQIQQTQN